jgi:hypothetical protein
MIRENFKRQLSRGVYICPVTGVAVHDPSKKSRSVCLVAFRNEVNNQIDANCVLNQELA